VGRAPTYRAGATGGEALSTFSQRVAFLRDSGELILELLESSQKRPPAAAAAAAAKRERRER